MAENCRPIPRWIDDYDILKYCELIERCGSHFVFTSSRYATNPVCEGLENMNCDALNPLNDFGYCWDAKGVMVLFEHYLRGGAKPQTSCTSSTKCKVEIDLGHTELQIALDAAVAQVEALRAERDRLKAEAKSAARQLRTIAGILGS